MLLIFSVILKTTFIPSRYVRIFSPKV